MTLYADQPSISGAIWNTVLPRRLADNLPDEGKQNATAIFRSIVVAQSFEWGTPMREAVNASYRQTQQTLAIASVAISAPLLIIMFFTRNVKLAAEDKRRAEEEEDMLAAEQQGRETTPANKSA